MKKLCLFGALSVLAICGPLELFAQAPSVFIGVVNAWRFAYGVNPQINPLRVDVGTMAGAGSITLSYGNIRTIDGIVFMPLSTTAKIVVGSGGNQETVTPTAVTCSTPNTYDTCIVTATFANTHGRGETVTSGSYGLGEAVNYSHNLGGLVGVDGVWALNGGATGTITSQPGWTNVTVLDWRGTSGAVSYKASSNGSNMAATTNVLY